jgi:hypothetical protein
MHDPVDQPSDSESSDHPCANDERKSPERSSANPMIRLDHAPAIEPEPNVDQAAHHSGQISPEHHDEPHLVTPTMWR